MALSSILKRSLIESSSSPLITALLPVIENNRADIIAMSKTKQMFYRDFVTEFTYDSNAIEGNTITLSETYDILENNVTVNGKSLKDQAEILGHAKAAEYLIKSATDGHLVMSEDLIKSLHRQIFSNDEIWTGEYRASDVGVENPATGEILHKAPPPQQVPDIMWVLLADYDDFSKDSSLNFLITLAGFHLTYENIHPFQDGNGRTGRLFVNFELIKHGYLPINIKYAAPQAYYSAFRSDDYTAMTECFLLRMQDSMSMYKQSFEKYKDGRPYTPPALNIDTIVVSGS
jgi:Fic family protein